MRASSAIAAALAALRSSQEAAPARNEPSPNPLGPYPAFKRTDGGSTMRPIPSAYPGLLSINVQDGLGICPVSLPETFSLRASGEEGPVNMVTAYSAARLAAAYLEGEGPAKPALAADSGAGKERTALILAPSPSQARLCRALLEDFGKAGLAALAGEPGDFEGFPPASLVILDTALGPPPASHPWAKGQRGAKAVLQALALAGGALVLVGPERRLSELPPDGPLGVLYRESADKVHADLASPLGGPNFQEALEKAKGSVFCSLPPMGDGWWKAAAPSFQGALRRKVKLTLFAAAPEEAAPDPPVRSEESLRLLKVSGAQVLLAEGFPGFAATVDRLRFFWGEPGAGPSKPWKAACSFAAPRASALIEEVLQLPLLASKLGAGPFRSCPLCGWPFLLVNRVKPRGFGNANPLRLGCMNPSCRWSRDPRPLDERWPFASPPVCREDGATPYERVRMGKKEFWACPKHPGGDPCPRLKAVPGDPPGRKADQGE